VTAVLSLLTVVADDEHEAFDATVRSVLEQRGEWEWLLGDLSPRPWVARRLAELAGADTRVRVVPATAPDAAAADLLAAARGDLVALLGDGDRLPGGTVERIATMVAEQDPELLYGDEAVLGADGERSVHRRPEWSPERLRHQPYLGRMAVVRRTVLEAAGGLRGVDDLAVHDLLLRVGEHAERVVRVPAVLSETTATRPRSQTPQAWDARVRVVQEHLDRVGVDATAARGHLPELVRLDRRPDDETTISVVIPTIGTRSVVWGEERTLVTETVRSVAAASRREGVEFVVVYDDPTPPEVLDELRALPDVDIRLVPFHEPFNFSAKCNVGAIHATGDVLVFLNDDMQATGERLLERLVAPLREPDVGGTGAKLLFEDGRIQHAGVTYGDRSLYHAYYRESADAAGVQGDLWVDREVSALTGACLAVRRSDYWAVGGFSEAFPSNYNDVDLCFKLRRRGLRLLWLHDVVLHHFESVTRDGSVSEDELAGVTARWGDFRTVRERFTNAIR
jgi:GT2 family glycosyltransferase